MEFVCPQCRGPLTEFRCEACSVTYPVICGIPDFRLAPDPYIGMEADRAKGQMLFEQTRGMTFEQAIRHYYAITPEDPPDLAEGWTRRALAEIEIAKTRLPIAEPFLDVGCSTGALLLAAPGNWGVDVAFRWLILAKVRGATNLVCANAEHLPFADGAFAEAVCFETLEHCEDAAVEELKRVAPRVTLTTNNRWAPLPEPHVHLWGVGWLPRAWQKRYVAWRRPDLHEYKIRLRSAGELRKLLPEVAPSPLFAPHVRAPLGLYNGLIWMPGIRWLAMWFGPRLTATRSHPRPSS